MRLCQPTHGGPALPQKVGVSRALVLITLCFATNSYGADPQFSVRDSIEMVRFTDPRVRISESEAKISPDKKYFTVVTSRGLVQSNEIESTLWIFRADEVGRCLENLVTKAPMPRVIARMTATPKITAYVPYGSIISEVSWSPDSRMVWFLAQNSTGDRQLYRADPVFATISPQTPNDYDVIRYASTDSSIIYEATRVNEGVREGHAIGGGALDVTGIRLASVLFPQFTHVDYGELWVNRGGRNLPVTDESGDPLRLSTDTHAVMSASPKGTSVVVSRLIDSYPDDWVSYDEGYPDLALRGNAHSKTEEAARRRLTEYTLVDLSTNRVTPALEAPTGRDFGYEDKNLAIWSQDEKKLLLTNVYLPLEGLGESERLKRLRPCAAVVVTVASHQLTCVAFNTYHEATGPVLQGASFGATDEEVILHFWISEGTYVDRRYRFRAGEWTLVGPFDASGSGVLTPERMRFRQDPGTLSMNVREDLNIPPALWATDAKTGHSRKIWDPNPQFATMQLGQASVIHWRDKSGYEWTGGLVLPPGLSAGKRYPFVIQTHGFAEHEFVTDGRYT